MQLSNSLLLDTEKNAKNKLAVCLIKLSLGLTCLQGSYNKWSQHYV